MRLTVEGLTLSRSHRQLVHDLSFDVPAGQALALTGANGAGKTTLLRAVAGLIRPDAGAIRFTHEDRPLEAEDARARLHWLGWQDGLRSSRTARDEARFWTQWAGGSEAAAHSALEMLGLAAAAMLDVRRLSAGQRRRLALVRLLAAPRDLWLLDEPLAPLDAGWRARFGELACAHLDRGGSILAAVHDPLPFDAGELRLS